MKKYIIFFLTIGIIIATILVYGTISSEENKKIAFTESGYILNNSSERYYFNEDTSYKNTYDDKITFHDTEGDKVSMSTKNFAHYTSGAITALEKSVLLDLNNIDNNPITYYNISANKEVKKTSNRYTIKNLDKDLQFDKAIWKISDSKYLIIGNNIKIVLGNEEEKEVKDYIEIEYSDNEIVNVYNQDIRYQTISSKSYLELGDNIKLNLGTKVVSKNDINKMTLENMVIDQEDNVTIADLPEDETKDENQTQNEVANETQNETQNETNNNTGSDKVTVVGGGGSGTTSGDQTTINDNSQTVINGEGEAQEENKVELNTPTIDYPIKDDQETIVDITASVKEPVFKLNDLTVTALGIKGTIDITDEEDRLVNTSTVKVQIINNTTGKVVYLEEYEYGVYTIELNIESLTPDTQYTITTSGTYSINEETYTKNFITKTFMTDDIGISIAKDGFTNSSLSFLVNFSESSKVTSADVYITSTENEVLKTVNIVNQNNQEQRVDFEELKSNTSYNIIINNICYDGIKKEGDSWRVVNTYKTLKQKAIVNTLNYQIDIKEGKFNLSIENVVDKDDSIQNIRYEICQYNYENEDMKYNFDETVYTKETTQKSIQVAVDGEKIQRKQEYVFRVITTTYDNEKIVETESEVSSPFSINGVEFPTLRFSKDEVTFESIKGSIIIEDENEVIDLNSPITVKYQNTLGDTGVAANTSGGLTINININNLKSVETYTFLVYANIDLQDGNGLRKDQYIGAINVTTEKARNLVANFSKIENDVKNAFSVNFSLTKENEENTDLEAKTLTGMTFNLYAGQSYTGRALKTVKLVDNNVEAYESVLADKYYNKEYEITPTFFGGSNSDYRDSYYTITLTEGYDYTTYKNDLPIINSNKAEPIAFITVATNGTMPDIPEDKVNIDTQIIRNRDVLNPREDLESETIVGYNVGAGYVINSNNIESSKSITYNAYNETTGKLVASKTINFDGTTITPSATFDVEDGTTNSQEEDDNEGKLYRGNRYYFTYTVALDLNLDGQIDSIYPTDIDDTAILRSKTVEPQKQETSIIIYASTSKAKEITYKYTCKDIDKALDTKEILEYYDLNLLDKRPIQTQEDLGTEELQTVTFSNLKPGTMTLYIKQRCVKGGSVKEKKLITEEIEDAVSLDNVTYNMNLEENAIEIKLNGNEATLNRVVAADISFKTTKQTITKTYVEPTVTTHTLKVNLIDIEKLIGQEIEVSVNLYYETGLIGYDMVTENAVYKILNENSNWRYVKLREDGLLMEDTTIIGNMYKHSLDQNILTLTTLNDAKSANIELEYTQERTYI